MSKNPSINAVSAILYIVSIGLFMNFGIKHAPKGDSVFAPIAMISLFTLSAAVMGYLFCLQPLQLYLDGKKQQAVTLFLQTVAVFGAITFVFLLILFTGVFR
jgi:hypothetical protein